MARRCPAPWNARGGVDIPAPRPYRARLATALGALAVCALLAGYAAWVAGGAAVPVGAIGLLALAVLTGSLMAGSTGGIAWTLALVAAGYAAALAVRGDESVDPAAPLVGAGVLVLAELAFWSLERRGPGYEEARVVGRRLIVVGVLALLSLVLGAFIVVVTAAPLGGGLAWDAVGVAAAGGTLAIVAWLVRRPVP